MIVLLCVLCALVGLLLYVLASNPKVQEIGRIMLFCGLLVTLFTFDKILTVMPK